jgi:hypothetical protein
VQVDEPALREGLPLKRARWESYLTWAVRAFRLSTVVAAPGTQIVTHLCYSEFADILHVRARPRAAARLPNRVQQQGPTQRGRLGHRMRWHGQQAERARVARAVSARRSRKLPGA